MRDTTLCNDRVVDKSEYVIRLLGHLDKLKSMTYDIEIHEMVEIRKTLSLAISYVSEYEAHYDWFAIWALLKQKIRTHDSFIEPLSSIDRKLNVLRAEVRIVESIAWEYNMDKDFCEYLNVLSGYIFGLMNGRVTSI